MSKIKKRAYDERVREVEKASGWWHGSSATRSWLACWQTNGL